jgi:hypothetical protein
VIANSLLRRSTDCQCSAVLPPVPRAVFISFLQNSIAFCIVFGYAIRKGKLWRTEELAMSSAKTHEIIDAVKNPLRGNNFEARRRALGLSRVALARIFDVDPATVFRRERETPPASLWNYALRGVEEEAKKPEAKMLVRSFKSRVRDETPEEGTARIHDLKYTTEKMHDARRQHAAAKATKTGLSKDQIKRIADRAEGRS